MGAYSGCNVHTFVKKLLYIDSFPSLCGVYSRAVTIREWHLLIPEGQSIEKRSIDTIDLGDSGPLADVEEG